MHPFAIDSEERTRFPFFIAIIAILTTWLFYHLLNVLDWNAPWWVETPSVLGLYYLFFRIFDSYLWKINWLRKVGNIRTPDLNGVWKGHLTSSYDNHAKQHPVEVTVEQSWTKMKIALENNWSRSWSIVGSFNLEDATLSYGYFNEPGANAPASMHAHHGYTILTMTENRLHGQHFSGRDRQNFGEIDLRKI